MLKKYPGTYTARSGKSMGSTPEVETPVIPDEPGVLDADDVVEGVGVEGWHRVRRVSRVGQTHRFVPAHAAINCLFTLG